MSPFTEYLKHVKMSENTTINFKKGQMTGRFEMGSTIILVFEADRDTKFVVEPDQAVKMGQMLVK